MASWDGDFLYYRGVYSHTSSDSHYHGAYPTYKWGEDNKIEKEDSLNNFFFWQ